MNSILARYELHQRLRPLQSTIHNLRIRNQHDHTHSQQSSTLQSINIKPTYLTPQRAISQPTHFTHPDLMALSDLTPGIPRSEFIERRRLLTDALPPNSLTAFLPNAQYYMSEDVPYPYHPNTDLFYACGMQEPGAILFVHRPSSASKTKYTLSVQPRNPAHELWDGPRCGPSTDVRSYFAIDDIIVSSDVPRFIADHLPQLTSFHFDSRVNPKLANTILSQVITGKEGRKDELSEILEHVWRRDIPPKSFLARIRLRKSKSEIKLMRDAAHATSNALNTVIASNDRREASIDARIMMECINNGATRMAFPSVVASGSNATVLHYMRKDAMARPGDLVMVDTGCEVHGYCSDVSRTWPLATKFSSPQRDMYSVVLDAHVQCIEKAVAGQSLDGLHDLAAKILTEGLLDLGFLKGHSLESALSTGAYTKYYPHAIGHYLGLDVHDTHAISKGLALENDMVVTIEPGLYCRADDESAPHHFRGIGMRLEDDVVVGDDQTAPEILSIDAVKEIEDVEHLVLSKR